MPGFVIFFYTNYKNYLKLSVITGLVASSIVKNTDALIHKSSSLT